MDAISDKQMKQIEEEMNRFESEIAGVGSNQMEQLQPPSNPFSLAPPQATSGQQPLHQFPPNQPLQHPQFQQPSHQTVPAFHMQNPPRPPPHILFNQQPPFNHRPMFPPMGRPPHPFSPMFVPPQLRNRPIVPPSRPPMSFSQNQQFPASSSTTSIPRTSNSSSNNSSSSNNKSSTIISAPKVVYSAPPVKNQPPQALPASKTTPLHPTKTPGSEEKPKNTWKRIGVDDDSQPPSKIPALESTPKNTAASNAHVKQAPKATKTTPTTKSKTATTTTTATKTTTAPPTTTAPTPPAPTATPATKPPSSKEPKNAKDNKKKKFVRMAAGNAWEDTTLNEWDPDDFRIFCGDLGNEVTDDVLIRAFNKYPSFQKARVIRDKRTNKTKGYGFASFKDPNDFMTAIKEVNGRYVGNRPIKLKKSCWQDRQMDSVKKREKEKKKLGYK